MTYPRIIQGGMGVAISTWQLANAVSRHGQLGVVSGTGIGIVLIARLMDGDPGGHMRRALSHFPSPEIAEHILKTYYVEGGIPQGTPYKRPTLWTVNPSAELEALTVAANFVEVWLAREGHQNPVGINLLEKVQMPNMASLYGAMLAGVDYVIMGAGIPTQIPGILDDLSNHLPVCYRLDVVGTAAEDDVVIHFDPQTRFPEIAEQVGQLKRPRFLPVVSSVVLAKALLKRASGEINGFVIEMPVAGGHNAPPRGQMILNENGEPIYSEKDDVDLSKFVEMGLPFWLAGGYGSAARLQEALAVGAQGIQVGTAFAYCEESGFAPELRSEVLRKVRTGELTVRTDPRVSPTGFPFKVVQIEGTASQDKVIEERERLCDVGYLRQIYRTSDGDLLYRCPAEPVDAYLKKDGDLDSTIGRKCLCNHLGAAAGYPQTRRSGYVEPAIVTSGDCLPDIEQFFQTSTAMSYTVHDVLKTLLS
ncbi:MAG: nitronate monooxygenase [Chloroflexi bacterium]|nr:nitronate monooxygenase [Chloroflexota bacterium]